ncbi:MAG: hypothetical protein ABH952_10380 [Candidatus Omnitrophota bacterium]
MEIQEQFIEAFNNFMALGEVLAADLVKLSESEDDSAYWRRNYIRVVASLLEGYSHCFREMAAIGFKCTSPSLSKKEQAALLTDFGYATSNRIKLSLRAFYKMFEFSPVPDFSGKEWKEVMTFFEKRNVLMHPKSSDDLKFTEKSWAEMRKGSNWLIKKHFDVLKIISEKYIKKGS